MIQPFYVSLRDLHLLLSSTTRVTEVRNNLSSAHPIDRRHRVMHGRDGDGRDARIREQRRVSPNAIFD